MADNGRRALRSACPFVILICLLGYGPPARSCDDPVYRYALTRWQRSAYATYYFYRGREAEADAEVNRLLQKATSGDSHANLIFRKLNVDELKPDSFEHSVWQRYKSDTLPVHLILTPRRTALFSGRLSPAMLSAIVRSPLRDQMARALCSGTAGVLLLMTTTDTAENERAEKVVKAVIGLAKKEQDRDVGFLKVARADKAERWFVAALLELEDDLKEIDKPMVFGIFGRARALEPYLSKGINEDLLAECLGYIQGPCSCEIKAQAPGMDLLTDWDWDGNIAETLRFTEEVWQPDLMVPEVAAPEPEPEKETGTAAATEDAPDSAEAVRKAVTPAVPPEPVRVQKPAEAGTQATADLDDHLVRNICFALVVIFVVTVLGSALTFKLKR